MLERQRQENKGVLHVESISITTLSGIPALQSIFTDLQTKMKTLAIVALKGRREFRVYYHAYENRYFEYLEGEQVISSFEFIS